MTFMISLGKWGGVYWERGFSVRLCLGWIAFTLIPMDVDDILCRELETPTVENIVDMYLESRGYDGLCDFNCGCFRGEHLMPCGTPSRTCQAGMSTWSEEEDCEIIHEGARNEKPRNS